jgi:poly(A) polymerase
MRDIWALQSRFRHHQGRRAVSVYQHPKFRAAYDFLCLRANAGEMPVDDCRWWTELQEKSPEQQNKILAAPRHGPRKRSPRKRKAAAPGKQMK